jgi:PAS domain S-box-containing protein
MPDRDGPRVGELAASPAPADAVADPRLAPGASGPFDDQSLARARPLAAEFWRMSASEARDSILETLLLDAIESANIAICVYDEQGRYVTVNECACRILGYPRAELLEHDVGEFTAGGINRTLLLSPVHREGVRLVRRRDGSTVPCAFVVTPTRVANLPYFVAVWWTLNEDDPRAADAA